MTDEEIRMRCLELIYEKDDINFGAAEILYKWVIQIREIGNTRERIKQNTITFEKVNQERNEK